MLDRKRATIASVVFVVGITALAALRALQSPSPSTSTSATAFGGSLAQPSAAAATSTSTPDVDGGDPAAAEWARYVAASDAACAALEQANQAFLAKVHARDAGDGCQVPAPETQCDALPDGGAAWGHRVVEAIDQPSCGRTYKLALARAAGGNVTTMRGHEIALQYDDATKYDRAKVTVLADYDGDGEPEILVEHQGLFREGVPFSDHELLTYKSGALSPYRAAAGIAFAEVADVNEDGRPDLLTRGPFGSVEAHDAMGNDWAVAPAIIPQIAQADGTFSALTKATVAYAHKKCGARKRGISFGSLDLTDESESALQIVCARLDGWPDADVARDAQTKCSEPVGDADPTSAGRECPTWWLELARVPVPFVFR